MCVRCVSGCNLYCQAQEAMRHAKKGSKMQAMKAVLKAYFGKGAAKNEEDVHVSVMCDVGSDVFMHVPPPKDWGGFQRLVKD